MIASDPQADVFWSMLEAIGTICASAIALFSVLYFEIIRPLKNKPELRIKYENSHPYSSLVHLRLGGKFPHIHTSIARAIRIGIVNTSKVPARGVRLKFRTLAGPDREADQSFIPYDLPWVDIDDTRREIIAKDEEAFAEFIIGIRDYPEAWWFQPFDPTQSSGFGNIAGLPKSIQPPFKAYAELVAYAENLESPVSQVFEITYDKPNKLGFFKMKAVDRHISRPKYIPIEEALARMEESEA